MAADLGSRAMYITAGNLLKKTEDQFVRVLTHNFSRVAEGKPSDSQKKAWRNCYGVLCDAFRELPESFLDLWIVFEYVLPRYAPWTKKFSKETHIRSDVILVGGETALVLEFKQHKKPFIGFYRQAMKYRDRLCHFHVESQGMRVEAALIVTKAKSFRGSFEDVPGCTPDHLPSVLRAFFGETPERLCNIKRWLDSDFSPVRCTIEQVRAAN